jgi:DNA-directed RNA polymerase specialized sigma24 family protein
MTNKEPNITLKTLTNCNKDNVPYFRRDLVTRQIKEVLSQATETIRHRILITDEASEDALKSETLVYLLREFWQTEMFNLIYETLSQRILRIIYQFRQQISSFDDFAQNIQLTFLEKVLDFETNQGDYAQVSFGEFIIGLKLNEYRKYGVRAKKDGITDSTDENIEAETDKSKTELASNEITIEKRLLHREALKQLPDKIREACILHYLKGWKIKSNNENEPTLAKHFQKSDRQIRNWLREAAVILADWKGVLR